MVAGSFHLSRASCIIEGSINGSLAHLAADTVVMLLMRASVPGASAASVGSRMTR